jgi:hypothetical protein
MIALGMETDSTQPALCMANRAMKAPRRAKMKSLSQRPVLKRVYFR